MRSILFGALLLGCLGVSMILFPACEDDPLFAPDPPPYTWNPGTLHADSVSYSDNDSIMLCGHYQPKALVITVKAFWISLTEIRAGAVKEERKYLLQKDVVWNFEPDNYADTVVMARLQVRRLIPESDTKYLFNVHLNIVAPPGYPSETVQLDSNSLEVIATGGG